MLPVGTVARTTAISLTVSDPMHVAILIAVLVGKFLAAVKAEGTDA